MLDQAAYIDRYPLAQRCVDGELPTRGVEIDESSGSSGRPYQWVRSRAELDEVERTLAVQAKHLLQHRTHPNIVAADLSRSIWHPLTTYRMVAAAQLAVDHRLCPRCHRDDDMTRAPAALNSAEARV